MHSHTHHTEHLNPNVATNRTFENRPISQLMSIVKNDLKKLDDEGLIDEGVVVKTVMACNDRLGIPIRDIKQACIPVEEFKAKLPLNFEKLYFAAAIKATNTMVHSMRHPFDNKFDRDILYTADLDRGSFGNAESYSVTIKRETNIEVHSISNLVGLDIAAPSWHLCHPSCPNMHRKGRHTISIQDDMIQTPFRSGEIYIMYLGTMQDEDGNILFPFHPLITPYYEWAVKEKILMDAIFNSDGNYGDLFKLAQNERVKAWLDAFNITTDKGYGQYVDLQRRRELGWYNQYFKYFK